MAKHVEVSYSSDLSGDRGAETVEVRVSVDIDLTPKEREKLFAFLAPYLEKGVQVDTAGTIQKAVKPRQGGTGKTVVDREQSRHMRAWLQRNGYQVSDRGRIPDWMPERYHTRTPNTQPSQSVTPAVTPSETPAVVAEVKPEAENDAVKPPQKAAAARKTAPPKAAKTNGTAPTRAARKAVPALQFAGSSGA